MQTDMCFKSIIQSGRTALIRASWEGETETVKLLIEHNADLNATEAVVSVLHVHKNLISEH